MLFINRINLVNGCWLIVKRIRYIYKLKPATDELKRKPKN